VTLLDAAPLLPPAPQLSDARRRLFEVAIGLFGAKSYDAVSVRDLASALGMAPGALYAHVPSKEHLLFELVRLGHETHRDALKLALLDTGAGPEEQIRALTNAHVTLHLEFAALARVTNREVRALSDEHLAEVLRIRAESERMFLDVIERGVRMGAFTVEEPRLAMLAIASMGVRAAEWVTGDLPYTTTQIAGTFADFACHLLKKP
jgi:AcrR family transcriptional regulator